MKKKYILILILLVIIPLNVFAATEPTILTLTAEATETTIDYTGTTEGDITAVMCKLFNNEDEELDMLSLAVDNSTFSGSFTNVEEGTYNVSCAKYEGGAIKKAKVVVGATSNSKSIDEKETTTTNNTKDNPKTYDSGIKSSIIILVISVIGIMSAIIYSKKTKANRK